MMKRNKKIAALDEVQPDNEANPVHPETTACGTVKCVATVIATCVFTFFIVFSALSAMVYLASLKECAEFRVNLSYLQTRPYSEVAARVAWIGNSGIMGKDFRPDVEYAVTVSGRPANYVHDCDALCGTNRRIGVNCTSGHAEVHSLGTEVRELLLSHGHFMFSEMGKHWRDSSHPPPAYLKQPPPQHYDNICKPGEFQRGVDILASLGRMAEYRRTRVCWSLQPSVRVGDELGEAYAPDDK